MLDLPEIQRDPGSVSNVSSRSSMCGGIDLEEGCIVTKTVKYTHQVAHLVNAVRGGVQIQLYVESSKEYIIEVVLKIILYTDFSLDDPCNLVLRHWIYTLSSHCLRLPQYLESTEPNSACLPPFRHDVQNRNHFDDVNIFLVALNAEIKFRRYLSMTHQLSPATPLPNDALSLMQSVINLVDLLYWTPLSKKGKMKESIRRKNAPRSSRPSDTQMTEKSSGGDEDEGPSTLTKRSRRKFHGLSSEDVETRKAYGSALMCGHDIDYDPALFEDEIPINAPLFDQEAMERWKHDVAPL